MRSRVVTQIEQERSDSIAAFATRYEIEPSLAAIVWDAALATGLVEAGGGVSVGTGRVELRPERCW